MKTTKRHQPIVQGQSDVQREIDHFLQALKSYPDQFARDPKVSFEQHMFCVAMEHLASGSEQRRRQPASDT